ncbi:PRC-barrel domain-containing protein [Caballeronia udeis]|uniref:PRC-barrel domain-containing protein n=1 Tax=Caballeronia udeis TaxID=1232866 RepID=A0A158FRG5_9BURK|nr:PRC-barrel domain-containing protein [Caballeronia udeis]SAL22211.1 PRC-barrel domain-containing protein [Caballeronia udeis]
MSGGFPLRAYEWHWRTVARSLAILLVLAVMSGCSLFPVQAPAPIVDLSTPQPASEPEVVEPEEVPASAPVATQPAVEPKVPRPAPKRRVVVPKKPPPPPPPPVEEKAPPTPPPLLTTRIMQHEQIRGLLDSEIQRPDGKVIGRAVDMYADATGKPKIMIVNLSGFLGVGDRKVTFPWTAFRFNPATKKAPITFALPTPGSNGASNAAKAKAQDASARPGSVNDIPPTLAQLIDSTVLQKNGARMGRVVDVLVDADAQPQALVIDLSDSLAADKRQVAANWPDLHVVSRNKVTQLQLDFTDAQIKAAPTYSPDQPIKIVSPVVPPPEPAASPEPASAAAAASSGPGSGAKAGAAAVARPSKQ